LTLQQTGTQANIAKTSSATNSNAVVLPPVRTLIIVGLVDGSNVSVYNANIFASPTVPIAGIANVGSTTVNTTVSNLIITADTINLGKYQAVYSYVYTTATGSATTSQTAPITVTRYANTTMGVTGLARVRPIQPERTNNPNALSTLTGSGTMSSSAIQRPGGLPGPARSSQSTYYSPAQLSGWKNAGPPGR
jgi:hypothetical protein